PRRRELRVGMLFAYWAVPELGQLLREGQNWLRNKESARMPIGIRTVDLRKVYTSPPPMAATGAMFSGPRKKQKKAAKKFEITALDGVSLEIRPGEIFGLLGPNGAGKSTAVGVLTTRVRPTSGEAWIGEHEVWRGCEKAKTRNVVG